jgi:agmatine deiminase
VVTVLEEDPSDSNYKPLRENLERLHTMKDQDGQPLRVVTLPMPQPMYQDGQRLPASYANFYIGNEVVLLPTYDPSRDDIARGTLQELFPTGGSCPSTARTWCGDWGRVTVSLSSGRTLR